MRETMSSGNRLGTGRAGLALAIFQAFSVGPGCVAMESADDGAPLGVSRAAVLAPTSGTGGDTIAVESVGAIWLMKEDGTGLRPLHEGDHPAWSPDGSHIVASRYTGTPGRFDIFLIDVRNGYSVTLTDSGRNGWPTFSPDGTKIVYARDQNIWVMDADDGGNKTQLTSFPPGMGGIAATPSFSPTGKSIVFAAPTRHLAIMNADGTGLMQLEDPGMDSQPTWSPDGTKIAYFRIPDEPESEPHVSYIDVNSDGTFGTPVDLVLAGVFEEGITWSPDSTKLAYGKNGQIHIRDLATGLTDIINAYEEIGQPAWEPTAAPADPAVTTPSGANVTVDLGVVTVEFASVTSPGTTTVLPVLWSLFEGPGVFVLQQNGLDIIGLQIQTTATYQGPVTVTLDVPGNPSGSDFRLLRVMHNEDGLLVDRTVLAPDQPAPDFGAKQISARTTSL